MVHNQNGITYWYGFIPQEQRGQLDVSAEKIQTIGSASNLLDSSIGSILGDAGQIFDVYIYCAKMYKHALG